MKECVTYHKAHSGVVQMAKERVEYSMVVCVFGDANCMMMLYMTV